MTGGEIVYFEMDPTGQLNEYTGQSIIWAICRIFIQTSESEICGHPVAQNESGRVKRLLIGESHIAVENF